MRLGVVGYLHGNMSGLWKALDALKLRGVEGICLTGDFAPILSWRHGKTSSGDGVEDILEVLEEPGLPFVWVPGNHDSPDMPYKGNTDRRLTMLCGLRVVGVGGSGPNRFGFPYEWDEEEIRGLELPPADILLCHCPPARTDLDRTVTAEHVGSEAIRELAAGHRGILVCGHIHEAAGLDRVGNCLCLNAGSLGASYAGLRIGLIDWSEERVVVTLENLATGARKKLETVLAGEEEHTR